MENEGSGCTMRTLAEHLGLSIMTVSRALRNAPGVSVSTRKRVLAAAREQAYQPDPSLAVLNAYRHRRRKRQADEPLAFLTNFPEPDGWRHSLTFRRYFDGAARRARQLGYTLEPFWIGDPSMSGHRASQILRGRGIRGVVIGPLFQGRSVLELNWEYFSTVCLGRSLHRPAVSAVSTHHAQAMELALSEAESRGYRRIGFAITHGEDRRTAGALRASFLLAQFQRTAPASLLPVLFTADFSLAELKRWSAEHEPEVLISSEQSHYELLLHSGTRTREQTAFIHLNVDPSSDVGGVDQRHDLVGEHAAAHLHLKLLQRDTGVPQSRDLLLLAGQWKNAAGDWRLRRRLPV